MSVSNSDDPDGVVYSTNKGDVTYQLKLKINNIKYTNKSSSSSSGSCHKNRKFSAQGFNLMAWHGPCPLCLVVNCRGAGDGDTYIYSGNGKKDKIGGGVYSKIKVFVSHPLGGN